MNEPVIIDNYITELGQKRPFLNWTNEALLAEGEKIVQAIKVKGENLDPLLEPLSYIWAVLDPKGRPKLNRLMSQARIIPIRWLYKVKSIVEGMRFKKTPRGRGHVYFVLLDQSHVVTSKQQPGLYIGQSFYTPERRFKNHKSGENSSSKVHHHGKFILMSLSHVFKPISNADLKKIEKQCLDRLKTANLGNLPKKIIRGG